MATILAVDDEPGIRALLEHALTLAGHDVVVADSGEHALAKLRRRPFDLMILDIMMPGLDGYSVLERIQGMPSRAGMPVIVVTARHDPRGVLREIEGGAVDHIVKPFHTAELEQAVDRALNAPAIAGRRRDATATAAEVYGSLADLVHDAQETAAR